MNVIELEPSRDSDRVITAQERRREYRILRKIIAEDFGLSSRTRSFVRALALGIRSGILPENDHVMRWLQLYSWFCYQQQKQ